MAVATPAKRSPQASAHILTSSARTKFAAAMQKESALKKADKAALAQAKQTLELSTPLGKVAVASMRANEMLLAQAAKATEGETAKLLTSMSQAYGELAKAWDSAGQPVDGAIALRRVDRAWKMYDALRKPDAKKLTGAQQKSVVAARQTLKKLDVTRKATNTVFAALAAGYRTFDAKSEPIMRARSIQARLAKAVMQDQAIEVPDVKVDAPLPSP